MKFDFNMRKFKYGSASTVYIALFVAIIIVVNIFAQFLTDRFSLKLDLTTTGEFSLSEDTREMLSGIEDEIKIYILSTQAGMEKNEQATRTLEMIQRYNTHSGGKVKYDFIDPNKNPQFFEKYPKARNSQARALVIEGPERYTVVESAEFAYTYGENNTNKVYYQSEEKLSSAILYVSSPEVSNAGFVTGHNEADVKALETIFKGNNFDTRDVDLLSGVPAEVNNLVIAAPTADFTAEEISALESFLSIDGNNLYVFWGMQTPTLPVLERYLAEWGFKFPAYLVCDESNAYMTPAFPVGETVKNDLIDDAAQGQLMPIFPRTRPIELIFTEKSYMRTVPLLQTQKSSYAKLLSTDKPIEVLTRESGDVSGPFTAAAIGERALGNTGNEGIARVCVFGTEGFADEEVAGIARAYNNTFLSQLVTYSNPDTLTMAIKPKVVSSYDLNITESGAKVLRVVLIGVIPLIIIAIGIFVFIRRKNR